MAKKLNDEKINEIIDAGISEFARCGYAEANTNTIARLAGVSTGVLFKYFKSKEGFFLACLHQSLDYLEQVISETGALGDDPARKAEALIRSVITFSREHKDCIRMYQMITAERSAELAAKLSEEIEGVSARAYGAWIARAQQNGDLRPDIDNRMAAFFFDNLLMMLQFTYSCSYFRQRVLTYTGIDPDDPSSDERMVQQLMLFLEAALKK